jgi:DNA-binding response OmpR family regulator
MSQQEPARVLVVMDQVLVADTIVLTLNHGTFDTRVAPTARAALTVLQEWEPILAVVDMDIGDGNLLERLGVGRRGERTVVPVIGLTRRGDLQTKLSAFEQGLDDILTVPFSPEELLARTVALYRRAYNQPVPVTPTIQIGEIEIDILNREVRAGSSVIHLTGLEQSLLYLLAANAGQVLSRDEILDSLWGSDFVSESNVVDRHIRALRAKLQNDWRQPRFIATVPGRGYRFIPQFSADSEREGSISTAR